MGYQLKAGMTAGANISDAIELQVRMNLSIWGQALKGARAKIRCNQDAWARWYEMSSIRISTWFLLDLIEGGDHLKERMESIEKRIQRRIR